MYIHVLGSAAGGGFPQWNCNCPNCDGVRNGTINAKTRTQSSICVSEDGVNWVIFNTSPDIRAQMADFPPLQPARNLRDTGIAAIIYMDSQIDHTTGLLMLREGCPHEVYCTDTVNDDLSVGFPVFTMLKHWNGGINRHPISIEEGSSFQVAKAPSLKFTAIPMLSNAPPYSPHRDKPVDGCTIGIQVEDTRTGRKMFYSPGLGEMQPHVKPFMEDADCLLVDGTFWREDEMQHVGVGTKLAAEMGHLPQSGEGGMIELLDTMDKPRKILIHINNTNPILIEDSPERATLAEHNIEVSYDGMDIKL